MTTEKNFLTGDSNVITGLLRKIGIGRSQTVLDFGCKNGNYTVPAARIVGKNGLVYALDKNNEKLDELMKKVGREGLKNIKRIDTQREMKIPLKNKIVDAVLLFDVIHLVGKSDSSTKRDRKKLYEEVYRVSKNNALISVYPTHLTTHTDINSIKEVKQEIGQYFLFEKRILSRLVHDDKYENGKILNFRKRDDVLVMKCHG